MGKIAIIYWSASGNTEQMAQAIAEGISQTSNDYELFQVSEFPADRIDEFSKIAFGCPAMGAEELEQDEFEPVFSALESKLNDKLIALFGSYDWGDGEWMRLWQDRIKKDNVSLFDDKGLIVHNTPDENDKKTCSTFGMLFAQA
ncbi:flavodoxin [Pectinatus haikarae]|uniref:Flavodoxin n=1 Tax=Pectinatus haikarae TaxID=349096 RepID=A0ABT9Y6E6_9FIRM|nr:flavodoxin [Pectinatus haikarae]MDQ0203289.1 flavodoxin short chain [Pectinatus haikarae]